MSFKFIETYYGKNIGILVMGDLNIYQIMNSSQFLNLMKVSNINLINQS